MSTQSPTAVRVYLARVRSALTDLPPAEVEEILEDVRPHMTEIAVELGEELVSVRSGPAHQLPIPSLNATCRKPAGGVLRRCAHSKPADLR
jgi:hypothetical protein